MRKKLIPFLIIILLISLAVVFIWFWKSGPDAPISLPSPHVSKTPPTPTPTPPPTFAPAPEGYFDDALFIGDSRTVGIDMVGGVDGATFFSTVGLSVAGACCTNAYVTGYGSTSLPALLQSTQFGKVYIMLGINDIGGDLNNIADRYAELVNMVRENQPNAIIYILANLHVSANQDSKGSSVNNTNINTFNGYIKELADEDTIFYLDSNERFDDENGTLASELTPDGIHFYGSGYTAWAEWLAQNVIVK